MREALKGLLTGLLFVVWIVVGSGTYFGLSWLESKAPPAATLKCPLTGETGHLVRFGEMLAFYETSHSRFDVSRRTGEIYTAEMAYPTSVPPSPANDPPACCEACRRLEDRPGDGPCTRATKALGRSGCDCGTAACPCKAKAVEAKKRPPTDAEMKADPGCPVHGLSSLATFAEDMT